MIKRFRCKDTEALFNGEFVRRFSGIERQAMKRLRMLDVAKTLEALAVIPSNRLEGLKGNRKGQCSIRINLQWRVCFCWEDDGATDVEIVDYH